jgi:hypothetical protein
MFENAEQVARKVGTVCDRDEEEVTAHSLPHFKHTWRYRVTKLQPVNRTPPPSCLAFFWLVFTQASRENRSRIAAYSILEDYTAVHFTGPLYPTQFHNGNCWKVLLVGSVASLTREIDS